LKDGKGVMVDAVYRKGSDYLPSDAEVVKMRPQELKRSADALLPRTIPASWFETRGAAALLSMRVNGLIPTKFKTSF
jgi:hypothetical protein